MIVSAHRAVLEVTRASGRSLLVFATGIVVSACAGSPGVVADAKSGESPRGDSWTALDADMVPDPEVAPLVDDCDPVLGIPEPLPACSVDHPCTNKEQTATSSDRPSCGSARYQDGDPRAWRDADGVERYACVFVPPGAGPGNRKPLVIWLHGGYDDADSVYEITTLRAKATSYAFGAAAGFVLASVQGRNLRWAAHAGVRDGRAHDFLYWDLGSPSSHPDIAHLDQLVDGLVDGGTVDPDRIHLIGWSAGGYMAELYGIARHETPSPGGQRVASVAVYSASNPFDSLGGCARASQPATLLPILDVGRDCDLVLCSSDHHAAAGPGSPAMAVEDWIRVLRVDFGNPDAVHLILDSDGQAVSACAPASECTRGKALSNHLSWINGLRGGPDHEIAMLDFLASHPRR